METTTSWGNYSSLSFSLWPCSSPSIGKCPDEEKPQLGAQEVFDEEQERRDIVGVMLGSLKPPGEPLVQLEMEQATTSDSNER